MSSSAATQTKTAKRDLCLVGASTSHRTCVALIAAAHARVRVTFVDTLASTKTHAHTLSSATRVHLHLPATGTGGKRMIEGYHAVARYLAFLNAASAPASLFERAQVEQWLDFARNEVVPSRDLLLWTHTQQARDAVAHVASAAHDKLAAACSALESWLDTRTVLVGERVSLADYAVAVPLVGVLDVAAERYVKRFPNLARWLSLVVASEPVRRVRGGVPEWVEGADELRAEAAGASVEELRALEARQDKVLAQLRELEQRCHELEARLGGAPQVSSAVVKSSRMREADGFFEPDQKLVLDWLNGEDTPVQQRLRKLCLEGGVTPRFRRAPGNYYDESLEWRRDYLEAAHTDELCKTIVLRNTKNKGAGFKDPADCEFYAAVVQYNARLHNNKVTKHVRKYTKKGSNKYNWRLCPQELSHEITGYGRNAVVPLGFAKPIPIVISHRLADLPGGWFWLGGGEVDVKWRVNVEDFVRLTGAEVADITYDD